MRNFHICSKCKKKNEWSFYVSAHWNEPILHTCECGNRVSILQGIVTQLKNINEIVNTNEE